MLLKHTLLRRNAHFTLCYREKTSRDQLGSLQNVENSFHREVRNRNLACCEIHSEVSFETILYFDPTFLKEEEQTFILEASFKLPEQSHSLTCQGINTWERLETHPILSNRTSQLEASRRTATQGKTINSISIKTNPYRRCYLPIPIERFH